MVTAIGAYVVFGGEIRNDVDRFSNLIIFNYVLIIWMILGGASMALVAFLFHKPTPAHVTNLGHLFFLFF